MAKDVMKSPAFQFYPKDWDADENVIPMSYEEEGVYFALCRRYWLAGNTLPSDLDALRRLLKGKPSLAKMQKWWEAIGQCFRVDGEVLRHPRLDRERVSQAVNRERRKKGGDARAQQMAAERAAKAQQEGSTKSAEGQQESSPSSPSSSPSSTATAVRESAPAEVLPMRRGPSGGALMGGSYLTHQKHGACNDRGLCVPKFLHDSFLSKVQGDAAYVAAFYAETLAALPDDAVPGEDEIAFWRAAWKRKHGSSEQKGLVSRMRNATTDFVKAGGNQ